MAKYTVELRELLKDDNCKLHIKNALSTYPLYTPEKEYNLIPSREELNQRILNYYKYREIGFESVGRFVDELEITMCEIMPRYNELFKTIQIMAEIEDPFGNVDMLEEYTETREGSSSTEGESSNEQSASGTQNNSTLETGSEDSVRNGIESNVNSHDDINYDKVVKTDTPQGELKVTAEQIHNISYANEMEISKHSNSGNSSDNKSIDDKTSIDTTRETVSTGSTSSETSELGTSKVSGTTSSTVTTRHHRKGNQGVNTYAHDMNEFRTSIIDVVNQIVTDEHINELFMLVY